MSFRYAPAAAQPAPVAVDAVTAPHLVTESSITNSWSSLTSPLKTRGLTPAAYSRLTEREFVRDATAKRHADLRAATQGALKPRQSVRVQTAGGGKKAVETTMGRPAGAGASKGLSAAEFARRKREADPFRPTRLPHDVPRLLPPRRAPTAGLQRGNYIYSRYTGTPNPALPVPAGVDARAFPYTSRPSHNRHEVNPSVSASYYSTHWDDPARRNNPYQAYEVDVVSPRAEEKESPSIGEAEVLSPVAQAARNARPSAASMGFGPRHQDFRGYLHHTVDGATGRGASSTDPARVLVPLASHLLAGTPAETQANGLALAVPFALARYVPMDPRDGDGKRGHANASGLGYGPSHRNYYKYQHDNREGKEDLALFRGNHCS